MFHWPGCEHECVNEAAAKRPLASMSGDIHREQQCDTSGVTVVGDESGTLIESDATPAGAVMAARSGVTP